jgi:AcrR family transcriptional regulator
MKSAKCSASPGRPRAFCVEYALDQALQVFWQKGYEGTSLSDLTAAMGINRPSLYAAYGNKEALFRKALERYAESSAAFLRKAMEEPTARAVVEHLLFSAADGVTCPDKPHGCLTVRCALSSGEAADSIRLELANRRANGEAMLRKRLERAKAEGDLPADANAADLARYVTTVYQGMSVQAAGSASREQLRRVAKTALKAWPTLETR